MIEQVIKRIFNLDLVKFWRGYWTNYRKEIRNISILAVFSAFFEIINLGALVPLLQILAGTAVPGGYLWGILESFFNFIHQELNFPNLLIIMGFLFLIGQVLTFKKKEKQARLWFKFSADLKKRIFNKLLAVDIKYHYGEQSGKFIDLLNRQAEYAASSVFSLLEIITCLFFIFLYSILLLYISISLTIICLVISIVSFEILSFLFVNKSKSLAEKMNLTNSSMNNFITERISLVKLIKTFSTEDPENKKFRKITSDYTINNTNFWMNGVNIETSFQIIIFILAIAILITSTIFLNLQIALLLVFIFILIRLSDPLRQLNAKRHSIAGELSSLEMIDQTLAMADDNMTIKSGSVPFSKIQDGIVVNHLSFAYNQTIPILKDISFAIRKNEMVALVGASGGGKSTLVDLIVRLIEPVSGEIMIDGVNIKQFNLKEYHRKIGFVSQDSFLFNDSVQNNICYGTESVDDEAIINAAKMANAHDFIMQLPDRYRTELGERGVKLSGGQKQRIALARALYRQPQILILDEATSALDSESEKNIQQSILAIKNKYTIIAIAHRLSTIENADTIFVIQDGQIVESGVHQELVNSRGVYSKYYQIQYKSANSDTAQPSNSW